MTTILSICFYFFQTFATYKKNILRKIGKNTTKDHHPCTIQPKSFGCSVVSLNTTKTIFSFARYHSEYVLHFCAQQTLLFSARKELSSTASTLFHNSGWTLNDHSASTFVQWREKRLFYVKWIPTWVAIWRTSSHYDHGINANFTNTRRESARTQRGIIQWLYHPNTTVCAVFAEYDTILLCVGVNEM